MQRPDTAPAYMEGILMIQHNILQFEIFHIGGKGVRSLDEVVAEGINLARENLPLAMAGSDYGTGIKTIVRIYDTSGRVTHLAKQLENLYTKRKAHYNATRSNLITNWYAVWQINRLNRQISSVCKEVTKSFVRYIDTAFKDGWEVARENIDHSFRPAVRTEYLELQQAAILAENFMLFIFTPNDLLAGRNKIIASISIGDMHGRPDLIDAKTH